MNVEYAATIPLRDILDKMGFQPVQEDHTGILLYPSFPVENANLSLQVDTGNNTWRDSDTGEDGGPVALVTAWLKSRHEPCALVNVLHWLKFNIGYPSLMLFMDLPEEPSANETYRIIARVKLQEGNLIRYAMKRGIPLSDAKELFRQVYVQHKQTNHEFVGLGFKNEDGGYSIYNSHTELHLFPSAITFIRGKPKPNTVHIFKDIFDYHAAVREHSGEQFTGDSIIMNTWQSLDNAAAYIRGYGYEHLCTWFDNSPAGLMATEAFDFLACTEPDLLPKAMNTAEVSQ